MAHREPNWLHGAAIVAVHRRVLEEYGGSDGVRDENLLQSALARPRQLHAYGDPDVFALAAAYAFGIARNHPFLDGNKRTAFMAAYIFLTRNGYEPQMSEAETVVIMNQLAAGEIAESEFAAWLNRTAKKGNNCGCHSPPPPCRIAPPHGANAPWGPPAAARGCGRGRTGAHACANGAAPAAGAPCPLRSTSAATGAAGAARASPPATGRR